MTQASISNATRRRYAAGAVLLGLLLYGLTTAPGVLWQDSGMFQFRVWHEDVLGDLGLPLAHPLYVLLAQTLTRLPWGDFAFKVNLFSALCSAVALGFLMDLLVSLTGSRAAAVAGTVLLAVSHTFWTHAVIAEVYSLYSLGLVVELWLLQRFFSRRQARWFVAALLINGLNLSNHLMALLHLPAYAGVVLWGLRVRCLRAKQLPLLAAAVVVGSAAYLSLIAGQIAGGESILATLKQALVGPPNRANVVLRTSFPIGRQALKTAQYFALNFPTPLALLAPLGLWAAWKQPRTRWFAAFGGAVFAIAFLFALRYLVPDQFVFFTPCYALFAAFVAIGAAWFVGRSDGRRLACVLLALTPVAVYEATPPLMKRFHIAGPFQRHIPLRDSYTYFLRPRKNGETSAARFARAALRRAAPDGLLIADTTIMNTLAYVRDIEGIERNVTLHFGGDVTPAPPAVELNADEVRPFAVRGRAFACTDAPRYLRPWIPEAYELVPDGNLFRLVPKAAD